MVPRCQPGTFVMVALSVNYFPSTNGSVESCFQLCTPSSCPLGLPPQAVGLLVKGVNLTRGSWSHEMLLWEAGSMSGFRPVDRKEGESGWTVVW